MEYDARRPEGPVWSVKLPELLGASFETALIHPDTRQLFLRSPTNSSSVYAIRVPSSPLSSPEIWPIGISGPTFTREIVGVDTTIAVSGGWYAAL